MRRAPSILNRIVLLHLAAFVGITAIIVAAAYFLLRASVDKFEESLLHARAQEVSYYLSRDTERWTLSLPADVAADYRSGNDGLALEVVDDQNQVLFSSQADVAR